MRWGMRGMAMAGAAACLAGGSAAAQSVRLPGGFVPGAGVGYGAAGDSWTAVTAATPLPVAAKAEAFQLVTANVASAPVTVYGGSYVVAQACAGYGTVTVRYRGPDGGAMLPLLTRTAADAAGGTLVSLGTATTIDATVTGTTGCNVSLSRVP